MTYCVVTRLTFFFFNALKVLQVFFPKHEGNIITESLLTKKKPPVAPTTLSHRTFVEGKKCMFKSICGRDCLGHTEDVKRYDGVFYFYFAVHFVWYSKNFNDKKKEKNINHGRAARITSGQPRGTFVAFESFFSLHSFVHTLML